MTCLLCTRVPTAGHLCATHADRLADTLIAIEREAELLSAVPSMAVASGGRSGTLASHKAPARLDAIALADPRPWTDSALGVLASWARVVREDRSLSATGAATVTTERRLLSTHLPWLLEQPWVDDLHRDLTALLRSLQRANGTAPEPPAGRCPMPHDDGTECRGPLWPQPTTSHAWRPLADRCVRTRVTTTGGPITCATCGATWTGPDLARLALILEDQAREARRPHTPDGRPMLRADELVAQGYATSVSAVRVTAHRRGHRATHGHYDPALFDRQEATA
jgi:hypothetical protein